MMFSYFEGTIINVNPVCDVNIFDIYDAIKNDNKGLTREYRSLIDKSQKSKFKREMLNHTTFSGRFEQRKDELLKEHSGLICLDLDNLPDEKFQKIILLLKSDPSLILLFVSPSGNGLKVVYPIDLSLASHEYWYRAYIKHVSETCYLPEHYIDKSCINVSRTCFLCHDPEVYLNPEIEDGGVIHPIDLMADSSLNNENPQISYSSYPAIDVDYNEGFDLVDRDSEQNFKVLIKYTENTIGAYRKGQRHSWIVSLAGRCNILGMTEHKCLEYAFKYFSNHPESLSEDDPINLRFDIEHPIKSVYHRYVDQFNTKFDIQNTKNTVPEKGNTDLIPNEVYESLPKFISTLCNQFTERERDIFFVGLLGALSVCFKNVSGRYSRMSFHPNLYLFVAAPPGSGKSIIRFAEKIVRPIHAFVHENSLNAIEDYERKKLDDAKSDLGKRPVEKMLFMPGNSSGTSIIQMIADSDSSGLIFETEADTLTSAISKEWGDFSDFIRKAFQHETVSYKRRTKNEYVEIQCPKLSVVLSGTPNQVTALLKSVENGLFSRFMFYTFKNDTVWDSPFTDKDELEFDQLIEESSNKLLEYYHFLNEHPEINFKFTQSQIEKFDQSFSKTLTDLKNKMGEGIVGSVFRLGIITFRIAMIISIIRMFEDGDVNETIVCCDQDFEAALTITNVLKEHTAFVFESQTIDFKPALKPEQARYFQALPEQFKRNEANVIADKIGLNRKTGESYLDSYLSKNLLTRIRHGHYAKSEITV